MGRRKSLSIGDYFGSLFSRCENDEWVGGTALSEDDEIVLASQSAQFVGVYGATSLKAEIAAREPVVANAAQFRAARKLLRELGGAEMIKEELVFSGFVNQETNELTLTQKPLNFFAMVAAEKVKQPQTNEDQVALGAFSTKFMICSNRLDHDMNWDSNDPKLVKTASMARRHKFLTTKDLHWQWFNPLVFGMASSEDNGVDARRALAEAEEMKAAALRYSKKASGWSDQVGLFAHIFGHNNVNSLFIHILDMSELGPGFAAHGFKNCPFDEVIKVLREEAASIFAPVKSLQSLSGVAPRKTIAKGSFFFAGTDGATSLKAEITGRLPLIKDAASFRGARRMLMEELGGTGALREELLRMGFIDPETEMLTTGTTPFNVFARVAQGVLKQPGMEKEQEFLGEYRDEFLVASNRPENDEHWDSDDPEWVSKASMSKRHRFLTTRDLHWQWFNALAFGLVPSSCGGVGIEDAITMVKRMKAAALQYTSKAPGWSDKVGLFFHVFGHNSVNSMHLHIVDLDTVGPAFWHFEYKNCELDTVLKVMLEEAQQQVSRLTELQMVHEAAQVAMKAADVMAKTTSLVNYHQSPNKDFGRNREIIEVNVGGEKVSLMRSTMLMAPKGSLLHQIFSVGSKQLTDVDGSHLPFLNYPSDAFKHIADHLRLMQLTPENHVLRPLQCRFEQREQVEHLAWLLGVDELILYEQPGRASPQLLNPRPSAWCCRRRPAKSADNQV